MSRILLCYDCHVVHFPIQWHSDFRLSSMRRHRNCYYLSLLFHSFRLCQYLKRKHFQQLLYSYIEEIPKLQSHHHAMHISYRLDQSQCRVRKGNFSGQVEKDFFGRSQAPFDLVTRKAVTPSAEELDRNPRSRSAKLRAAVKR